ncbi:Mitochondrial inner membrane organizing system component [Microbotryomycetes sp. JL221]|nr:Mitochondrial inner membrane organizing system component [Microbotryomycetes sp. JL221]
MAAPSQASAAARSEDILSAKTDLCISNAIVKAGVGFGAGVVASAILFRRRPWPVLLGLGFGFGQGYSDCERVFNPASVPGFKIQDSGFKQSSPYANLNPFGNNDKAKQKASEASQQISQTASDAKQQAKSIKDAVVDKAKDAKDAVVQGANKVEAKVDEKVKSGPKWV